ncbi:hypothetical protein [Acinetobacter haemolyticus]|uniref:hypothetical protein n=1 Tax=Acinetobacter haemolyticus TaxID=29430 RepID=UPI001331DCB5|nr:hypothetical protein [Acinetobacter haemolyticus]NAS03746.1 hypothetical protein [Acinetobacter haemolyticus]NAS10287.1 hypothetical protein [Acinetobacter haemolyticus]QHI32255.1 hypothetical protein Ahae11616_06105 [Acinetobacter haemolyticus]
MTTFNAMEKTEALNYLNIVTKAYAYQGYTHVVPVSLASYSELIHKIKTGKRFRIFTNNLTAISHPFIPNLYVTNLGRLVLAIVGDNTCNPYTTGRFQSALVHPEIALLSQLMFKYQICDIPIGAYQYIEQACEMCFADFKVQIQTRAITTQCRSWSNRFGHLTTSYDRFLEFICGETNRFEVHSLVVQRKLRNGLEPVFGDPDFRDMSAYEIVQEQCQKIIQVVWRNRRRNDVLGILSREEMDIEQAQSIRLIFFVRKKHSDLIKFNSTPLYQTLEPYLMNLNLDHVVLGTTYTMNSGNAPLFQGQEQNYYDLKQIHVGNRLNVLKAQLVIPDYWFRLRDNTPSLKVERGKTDYER